MADILVNAVGEQCPIPVVKATQALRAMREPGTLEVLVDNEIAVHLASVAEQRGEKLFAVTMTVTEPMGDAPVEEIQCADCAPAVQSGGVVVAVGTDVMGQGSDELGKTLMKGFLFALGQLPQLPETVLFYNGGARLTVEGSDSLEDLRALEARGVEILTCGTCLNYYGLTEKLSVGSVTNMYAIAEKLAGAGKVVRP